LSFVIDCVGSTKACHFYFSAPTALQQGTSCNANRCLTNLLVRFSMIRESMLSGIFLLLANLSVQILPLLDST
jgi:hypothetical protein